MSLSAFLAENAVPVENIKFVASKRFLGEDGNPIWVVVHKILLQVLLGRELHD